jgi:hypothetical protein
VCSSSTIHLSGHRIILISTDMSVKFASSSMFLAGVNGNIVLDPFLLFDGLAAQQYHDFLEAVLLGLLEVVPLGVRQRL